MAKPPIGETTPPFQSKYRPYADVIRAARYDRKTWKAISEILRVDHGVEGASASSVYEFFKRLDRSKGRVPLGYPEFETPVSQRSITAAMTRTPEREAQVKRALDKLRTPQQPESEPSPWDDVDPRAVEREFEESQARNAQKRLIS